VHIASKRTLARSGSVDRRLTRRRGEGAKSGRGDSEPRPFLFPLDPVLAQLVALGAAFCMLSGYI